MSAEARRGRWQLLGLAALFFAPLLVAAWLYLGPPHWRPEPAATHGDLFDPPRPLPAVSLPGIDGSMTDEALLRGRWTLLYIGPGDCPERCRQALVQTRQIRLALGRNAERVQRAFLFSETCCDRGFLEREHPDLIVAWLDEIDGRRLLDAIPPPPGDSVLGAGRIYIVDPLGNLVLGYDAKSAPDGILEDLKRLLRLSRIG